jgi:hypothetical protein
MNLKEARIGLDDISHLFKRLSKKDRLTEPDYAVFFRKTKALNPYVNVPDYEYVGGNIPEFHEKLRWHSGKADGEYLGKFDVIELYSDAKGIVSALTAIHEYLHYRNKHKGIEMTEDEVHEEAKRIYEKIGY